MINLFLIRYYFISPYDKDIAVILNSYVYCYSFHLLLFNPVQVVCKENLTGSRSYWEVDWRGTEIDIAVTYRGIRRKGNANDCSLGWNEKSWSLYCSESSFSFVHANKRKDIPVPSSSRIGVYVDRATGTLAFYSVSNDMQLLHKVNTTFTEPLYPAFSVWGFGTTIRL